ncbi:MAG: PIN domain-containing protein [Myxococcota bacterium]
MRVLIDTNVLLDVALAREPHVESSAELLDMLEAGCAQGFMTSHSVATLYYLFDSKVTGANPVNMIRELLSFIEIASLDTRAVKRATSLAFPDFEDAMQAVAAVEARCDVIACATRETLRNRQSGR